MRTLLDESVIRQSIPDGWEYDASHHLISKTFIRKDFLDAVAFISRVAEIAERVDHHPDILLHKYNKVRITYTTHSAGGVTDMDIQSAREVDAL